MQNVLLRCPGHFNDYKIPVPQWKNYTPSDRTKIWKTSAQLIQKI